MKENLLIVCVLFLVISSLFVQSSEEELPTSQESTIFINKLLDSYNLKAIREAKAHPEFFPLYTDIGESFRVTVKKASDANTNCVYLLFEPIKANEPVIKLDYDNTYFDFFNGLVKDEYICKTVLSSMNPKESRETTFVYENDVTPVPYNFYVNSALMKQYPLESGFAIGSEMASRNINFLPKELVMVEAEQHLQKWGSYIDKCGFGNETRTIFLALRHDEEYSPDDFRADFEKIDHNLYYCKYSFFKKWFSKVRELLQNNPIVSLGRWLENVFGPYDYLFSLIFGIGIFELVRRYLKKSKRKIEKENISTKT